MPPSREPQYSREGDAQQEVDGFAGRLRDHVDLDAMVDEVVDVVSRTVQPVTVSLWLADHIDR